MADYALKRVQKGTVSGSGTSVGSVLHIEGCNQLSWQVSGLTAENVQVQYTLDNGSTWSANAAPFSALTGAAAATTQANGVYYLPVGTAISGFRINKSSATETASITYIALF